MIPVFSEKVRSVRKILGVQQDEFAHMLDVSTQMVSAYENAKSMPSFGTLAKLSEVSGKPVAWFFLEPGQDLEGQNEPRTVTPSEALQVLTQFIRSSDERADSLQRELAEARREIARLRASRSVPTSYVAEVDDSHYTRRRSRKKRDQNNEHKESS